MHISPYIKSIRSAIGHDLLMIPSVAVICRNRLGNVLMARHSEGDVWAFPGGAIEPMEDPRDAVRREMREETGMDVEPGELLGLFGGPEFRWSYSNGDEVNYVIAVFEVLPANQSLEPDNVEVIELRYFSPSELRALDLRPWVRTILRGIGLE